MSTIEEIEEQIKQKKREIENLENDSGNNLLFKLDLLNQTHKIFILICLNCRAKEKQRSKLSKQS